MAFPTWHALVVKGVESGLQVDGSVEGVEAVSLHHHGIALTSRSATIDDLEKELGAIEADEEDDKAMGIETDPEKLASNAERKVNLTWRALRLASKDELRLFNAFSNERKISQLGAAREAEQKRVEAVRRAAEEKAKGGQNSGMAQADAEADGEKSEDEDVLGLRKKAGEGADGADGADGAEGAEGADGAEGTDGANGAEAAEGADSLEGAEVEGTAEETEQTQDGQTEQTKVVEEAGDANGDTETTGPSETAQVAVMPTEEEIVLSRQDAEGDEEMWDANEESGADQGVEGETGQPEGDVEGPVGEEEQTLDEAQEFPAPAQEAPADSENQGPETASEVHHIEPAQEPEPISEARPPRQRYPRPPPQPENELELLDAE